MISLTIYVKPEESDIRLKFEAGNGILRITNNDFPEDPWNIPITQDIVDFLTPKRIVAIGTLSLSGAQAEECDIYLGVASGDDLTITIDGLEENPLVWIVSLAQFRNYILREGQSSLYADSFVQALRRPALRNARGYDDPVVDFGME